jgi:hypothetical protein
MPWTSKHLKWLKDTGKKITTADGIAVEIWELKHKNDPAILTAWAKHFRNHYCLDAEIDELRNGTGYSREEYLLELKFPDERVKPGPSIRSGDFGEVLVADYLEYLLEFWVPRTRYGNKTIRNESTKGCDIIGIKEVATGKDSKDDTLAIFEVKAQLTGQKTKPRLQNAIDGSAKDKTRRGESLNAIKQRLYDKDERKQARRIERFQNPEDKPYKELYGAAAVFSEQLFDENLIKATKTENHPNPQELRLIVIYGEDMMKLVHELYRRAADEA